MSCKVNRIMDRSELYKNRLLIDSSEAVFEVVICNSVNINITDSVICCGKRKLNRINFVVENIGDSDILNGKLNVFITSNNFNFIKTFQIFKIKSKCRDSVYVDVPFNCCFNYLIKAQVVSEDEILKEKRVSI